VTNSLKNSGFWDMTPSVSSKCTDVSEYHAKSVFKAVCGGSRILLEIGTFVPEYRTSSPSRVQCTVTVVSTSVSPLCLVIPAFPLSLCTLISIVYKCDLNSVEQRMPRVHQARLSRNSP
jgi:hypothetical protein